MLSKCVCRNHWITQSWAFKWKDHVEIIDVARSNHLDWLIRSNTAVIITIGLCNFSTLMGFLSASVLISTLKAFVTDGKPWVWAQQYSAALRFTDSAKLTINTEKLEGPIDMITTVSHTVYSFLMASQSCHLESCSDMKGRTLLVFISKPWDH